MIWTLFWGAVAIVLYTYAIYPLLLALRSLFWRREHAERDTTPEVSLIICAHNEASGIAAKLDNSLSLDYPSERLEVLVASDGSTDRTDEIARRYASRGVRVLSLPRRGKIAALNDAVAQAHGEILVFSDANSMYGREAIRALVRPFADERVGGVAGDQRYIEEPGAEATGERAYWDFDRRLKQWQSRSWSATSATGAIYAIRSELFRTVPPSVTDDFFVSTSVIERGYRLVFAPEAVAWERAASSSDAEFRRKVRVITRGLHAVLARRALLNPFRYGFYSVQLFSHKVLRRLVVLPLLALLIASPLLWSEGALYRVLTVGQAAFYGAALLGALLGPLRERSRLFSLPHFFCMVNLASLVAAGNVLRGHRIDSWQPERLDADGAPGVMAASTRQGPGR